MNDDAQPLLEIIDLSVSFDNGRGPRIRAVDGLHLAVHPKQTLALVGESGCGKSVSAMTVLRLVPCPPGRIDGGSILFQGGDLLALSERDMRRVRGNDIAMIFQEPMSSLNPVFTIGDQIIEAILLHQDVNAKQARRLARKALDDVGIADAETMIDQYPHQFSGGMRQRVMIAMALACEPKLLLADEPSTALDVTIQARILDLLRSLQDSRDMGIMLITHDMGVVAENADVVCVMYAGRVVEYATVFDLFENPLHPYTRGLLASIPTLGDSKRRLTTIRDVIDNPDEFTRLPGAEQGVRPWWPDHEQPTDLVPDARGRDDVLDEIAPDHWVGVWRTEAVAQAAPRWPNLTYRVQDGERFPSGRG
ncbi:MAG: ABC transporter ATP-binding protein [Phycisphaerales bacterium]|nr:ABC transporter ATP-binding protein [Phycisphaerales bacterium]